MLRRIAEGTEQGMIEWFVHDKIEEKHLTKKKTESDVRSVRRPKWKP